MSASLCFGPAGSPRTQSPRPAEPFVKGGVGRGPVCLRAPDKVSLPRSSSVVRPPSSNESPARFRSISPRFFGGYNRLMGPSLSLSRAQSPEAARTLVARATQNSRPPQQNFNVPAIPLTASPSPICSNRYPSPHNSFRPQAQVVQQRESGMQRAPIVAVPVLPLASHCARVPPAVSPPTTGCSLASKSQVSGGASSRVCLSHAPVPVATVGTVPISRSNSYQTYSSSHRSSRETPATTSAVRQMSEVTPMSAELHQTPLLSSRSAAGGCQGNGDVLSSRPPISPLSVNEIQIVRSNATQRRGYTSKSIARSASPGKVLQRGDTIVSTGPSMASIASARCRRPQPSGASDSAVSPVVVPFASQGGVATKSSLQVSGVSSSAACPVAQVCEVVSARLRGARRSGTENSDASLFPPIDLGEVPFAQSGSRQLGDISGPASSSFVPRDVDEVVSARSRRQRRSGVSSSNMSSVVPKDDSDAASPRFDGPQQCGSARSMRHSDMEVKTTEPKHCQRQESGSSVSTTASVVTGCHSPFPLLFETGSATLQGCKVSNPNWRNQDRSLMLQLSGAKFVVGVFDGHGHHGATMAECTRDLFEKHAQSIASLPRERLGDELKRLFRHVHSILEADVFAQFSGTTATVAVIDGSARVVTVAHAGDSSLMVAKGSEVLFVTPEHRVDIEAEQRIGESGGEVRATHYAGEWTRRVYVRGQPWPGLAMARSLGDVKAHSVGVLCEPQINTVALTGGSTVVVASDGVWDKMAPQDVVEYAASTVTHGMGSAPESVARGIAAVARARWPTELDIDDITAVVVHASAGEER